MAGFQAIPEVEELPDLNTFVVDLAERDDGSGERLEVHRALSFDEQDRELGQDTYCLCLASGETHYGGVTAWSVDEARLDFTLDERAATTLGTGPSITLSLGGNVALGPLRSALERIFGT